jgi:hypothetical protein
MHQATELTAANSAMTLPIAIAGACEDPAMTVCTPGQMSLQLVSIARGGRLRSMKLQHSSAALGTRMCPAALAASSEEKPRFFLRARAVVAGSPIARFIRGAR